MSIKTEEKEKENGLVINCVEVENPHVENVNKMENIPPSLGSGSAVGKRHLKAF